MFIRVCALILAVALATSTSSTASSEEAIVTSEKIDWKTFDEGMSEIKQSGKPGIVLIQRPSCPACRNLNAILARSTKIQDLSKSFVMIRCNSGENLHDEAYKGDGSYVPRLFFVSPRGEVLTKVTAVQGESRFKYYYYSEDQLFQNMQHSLQKYNLRACNVC